MTAVISLVLLSRMAAFLTLSDSAETYKVVTRLATILLAFLIVPLHRLLGGRRWPVVVRHRPLLWSYIGLLALGAVSLTYTTNYDQSRLQLVMYAESLLFVVVFCWAIARCGCSSRLPVALFWALALFVVVCIVGARMDELTFYKVTHEGTIQRLGGTAINANVLGMLCAMGIAAGLHFLSEEGFVAARAKLPGLALLVVGLVMTSSRSGMVATAVAVVYFARRSRRRAVSFATLTAFALLALEYGGRILLKQGDREEVMSMTGRIPFWTDLLTTAFPERPVEGFGFQCIWYESKFRSEHSYEASMAHNTFLQVLLGLGLIGFLLATFQLLMTLRAAHRSRGPGERSFFAVLLIPLLVNSVTEFGIFGLMNHAVTLYQLAVMLLVLRTRTTAPGATLATRASPPTSAGASGLLSAVAAGAVPGRPPQS